MSTVGARLLSSLIASDDGVSEFLQMGLDAGMFQGDEVDVFSFIEDHVLKHGVIPKKKTIKEETDFQFLKVAEPPTFYLAQVEDRVIHTVLKNGFLEADGYLKAGKQGKALDMISNLVMKLNLSKNRREIVNFTEDAADALRADYTRQWTEGDDYGVSTGWPTLDTALGSLQPGDLMAICGRPASGKTYLGLYMALHAWQEQGKIPMFISMEMKPLALMQRIAAILTSTPAKTIKHAQYSTKAKAKVFNALDGLSGNRPPFWIIDGNLTANVLDIALMTRQLKPDCVYVDGAYLLQHHERVSNWERVSKTCESLKQMVAGDLDIPVVASYQFNRDQTKVKEVAGTGLEHIAGTDAIGQIASLVLGLFGEDTVEEAYSKRVNILKGRSGEAGGFDINWLFDKFPFMDFSEIASDPEGNDLKKLDYM